MDNFRSIVLNVAPRIFGFLDRNPDSKTYGCFERYFWHYKLLDFPNSRFQEGALLLAFLFKNKFSGNLFFNKDVIYKWCISAIKYWADSRNRNGSVNEVYPYENSFCATSMSTYAISEALLILGEHNSVDLEKTGIWLASNSNQEVINQEAGASIALLNIYFLSKKKKFMEAADNKIENIIRNQDESGFYPEYNGYDIGYQSLTLSLLSKYYKKRRSEHLFSSIQKGVKFIEQYIGNNGHYNNSFTSRKTQFLYPYCFSIFGNSNLNKIIEGLKKNEIVNPMWLDDRYVIPLTIDYVQTYLEVLYENVNDHP